MYHAWYAESREFKTIGKKRNTLTYTEADKMYSPKAARWGVIAGWE